MAIKVRSEAEIEWRQDFDVKEKNPKWLNIQVKFKQETTKTKTYNNDTKYLHMYYFYSLYMQGFTKEI